MLERVGIPEPVTGPPPDASTGGSFFAFLFYSTDRYGGHVQVAGDAITVNATGGARLKAAREIAASIEPR